MSIPTIASVTPATGLTKGRNVIRIDGTGFRVAVVPASGHLGGPAQQTVGVQFGGIASPWAESISDTVLFCRVPEWTGAAASTIDLDVRVANLDDNGDEIATENVTSADAYVMTRPDFTAECYLTRIIRELLRLLKRHLMANVSISLGRDYDNDTTDWERLRAMAPAIQLSGPMSPINRMYSINREDVEEYPVGGDAFRRRNVPVTVDLDFMVKAWAKTPMEAQHMGQQFLLTFRDIVDLTVAVDPGDPSRGNVSYEIEVPWGNYPTFDFETGYSDLFSFDSRLLIRGVHLDDESGTIIEQGWRVTTNDGEPTLESEPIVPA